MISKLFTNKYVANVVKVSIPLLEEGVGEKKMGRTENKRLNKSRIWSNLN